MSNFKTYYKFIIIKSIWYRCKIDNPKMNPHPAPPTSSSWANEFNHSLEKGQTLKETAPGKADTLMQKLGTRLLALQAKSTDNGFKIST